MDRKLLLVAGLGILSLSSLNSAAVAWPCAYCWNQLDKASCNNTDGSCQWDGVNTMCVVASGQTCEG